MTKAEEINAREMKEVLEEHGIEVRRRGSHHVALCPWHDDHHPSLVVYEHTCWCPVCMDHRKSVIDTLMYLRQQTFLEVIGKEESHDYRIHFPKPPPPPKKPKGTYLPISWLSTLGAVDDCSLAKCMKSKFHPTLVDKVVEDYRLVCYSHFGSDDDTLFPNIDRQGRVHNVKLQRYETDRRSERFFHCDRKCTYWMGAIWKRQGKIPQDTQIDMDCLFGEHLLAERPNCDVVVVESPKNAVVGAAAFPRMVWVATGSKSLLCRERMECLRGRRVIVIPDTDAVADWREKISSMQDIASFVISGLTEEIRKIGDKADVADWIAPQSPLYLPPKGEYWSGR